MCLASSQEMCASDVRLATHGRFDDNRAGRAAVCDRVFFFKHLGACRWRVLRVADPMRPSDTFRRGLSDGYLSGVSDPSGRSAFDMLADDGRAHPWAAAVLAGRG